MLSTFTVTSTADDGSKGTLRWAITQSNQATSPSTIDFNIPGAYLHTISPQSALPTITEPVTIDGTGEELYGGIPLITLSGSGAGSSTSGMTISASNVTVEGLAIDCFGGDGVLITGGSDDVVAGDFIGLTVPGPINSGPISPDFEGNTAAGNGGDGVHVQGGATGVTIGGTSATARDAISANAGWGVFLTGQGTSDNVVEGDTIGTDSGGSQARPNGHNGVDITSGASGNTIGGTAPGSANVISGNAYNGVDIAFGGASNNVVEGNFIGTNDDGTAALPNGSSGVVIEGGANNNLIGGTTAAAANAISGNGWDGVHIVNSGTTGNVVEGNLIGTNAAGSGALGNGASGVAIFGGASSNTVGGYAYTGGASAADRNVISGNAVYGVYLSDSGTSYNLVESNFIGTDATGTYGIANGNDGVIVQSGASSNGVYFNVISASGSDNVLVTGSGTSGNIISDNEVGTNAAGNAVVSYPGAYYSSGISVEVSNGAYGTYVYDNVIAGSFIDVEIDGSATDTWVLSNDIGTDVTGTLDLGNEFFGIYLYDTSGNTVESNTVDNAVYYGIYSYEADRNTVAYNAFAGDAFGNQVSYD